MQNDQEAVAVARISEDLNEAFVRLMGKEPDPQAVKAEAEELVSRYGPAATLSDILA
jgi:hypothetical protein